MPSQVDKQIQINTFDKIHFLSDVNDLPSPINNTEDYPFVFEIQKLRTLFKNEVLSLVEVVHEHQSHNEYNHSVTAFIIFHNTVEKINTQINSVIEA